MAHAKQCDRCFEFYTERPANIFERAAQELAEFAEMVSPGCCKTVEQQKIEAVLDLCPKCSKSLTKWLNGKEGCDNGRCKVDQDHN